MTHLVNPNPMPLNKIQDRHRDIKFSKLVINIFFRELYNTWQVFTFLIALFLKESVWKCNRCISYSISDDSWLYIFLIIMC